MLKLCFSTFFYTPPTTKLVIPMECNDEESRFPYIELVQVRNEVTEESLRLLTESRTPNIKLVRERNTTTEQLSGFLLNHVFAVLNSSKIRTNEIQSKA